MKQFLVVLFIPFVFNPVPGLFAQQSFTLKEVLELALKNSPALAIAETHTDSAYYQYLQNQSSILPDIELGIGPYHLLNDAESQSQDLSASISLNQVLPTAGSLAFQIENTMTMDEGGNCIQNPSLNLSISQPLFVNGKIIDSQLFHGAGKTAEISHTIAKIEQQAEKNRIILQVIINYYSILFKNREIALLEKRCNLLSKELDYENLLRLQGNGSISTILEIELNISLIEKDIIEQRFLLRQEKQNLSRILDMEGDREDLVFSEEIPAISPEEIVEEVVLLRLMEEHNPEIQKKKLSLEQTQIQAALEGRNYSSQLLLSCSIQHEHPENYQGSESISGSFSDLFSAGSTYSLNGSIGLTIPVFTGRQRRYQERIDRNREFIAQQNLESSLADETSSMEMLFLRYESLNEELEIHEKYVTINQLRIQEAERMQNTGSITPLEAEKIRLELKKHQNNLWHTKAEIFISVCTILSRTGMDLERNIFNYFQFFR
ncbi:MAG: TolC family protein [Spirochaetales bacterium]|nr:TolC family protein [Spirochaetales bacterium]